MAIQIIWSENAVEDFERIIRYLNKMWTEKIALEFEYKVYSKVELLASQPQIGRTSTSFNTIKSILITKHNRLYYQISDLGLEVLNILDTRQNPDKNIYE